MAVASDVCVILRAQENRYVGFGNTVPPQKREDDFLNNAMSSLYSVRRPRSLRVPPVTGTAKGLSSAKTGRTLYGRVGSPGAHDLIKGPFLFTVSEWSFKKIAFYSYPKCVQPLTLTIKHVFQINQGRFSPEPYKFSVEPVSTLLISSSCPEFRGRLTQPPGLCWAG